MHVNGRDVAPSRVPAVEMLQFDPQDGTLHLIQPAVEALALVYVLNFGAIVAQDPHLLCNVVAVGRHSSAVTEATQVLCRVKAPCRNIPQATHLLLLVSGSVCLCRILEYAQLMLSSRCADRIHIGRLPVQVHGKYQPGPLCERRFDTGGIDVVRISVRLDRYRCRSDLTYR